ncbi:hypothetical protein [Frigoribacterium sp. UYMn621]|uniref:hypothetical protein n=1 Tax=Frigoribacterium sp. UYMn621 TaxID=3156343 RepID=UPI003395959F
MILSISSSAVGSVVVIDTSADTSLADLQQIAALASWGSEATIAGQTITVRFESEPMPGWLIELLLRERFAFAYLPEPNPDQSLPPWLDRESWTAEDRLLIRSEEPVSDSDLLTTFGDKADNAGRMFASGARFDRYAVARVDGWLWGFVPLRGVGGEAA